MENKVVEYRCPLCTQTVSKEAYEKITGIWKAREKALKEYKIKLKALNEEKKRLKQQFKKDLKEEVKKKISKFDTEILALKQQNREDDRKAKQRINKIIKNAKIRENKRVRQIELKVTKKLRISQKREIKEMTKKANEMARFRIKRVKAEEKAKADKRIHNIENSKNSLSNQLSSQARHINDLQKQNRELQEQLAKETTPQIEGLLYEDKLLKALQDKFPNDKFKHTGKGGDIIHFVINRESEIGIIVYECKRVKRFQKDHIEQTAEAKLKRNADFAILVTKATKKDYKGFGLEKGVLIVHPAGVLSLADFVRKQLVIIDGFKLTKAQREEAIEKIIRFIESAEFRNKLEAIIQETIELYESLKKEINIHFKNWKDRYNSYKNIYKQTIDIKDKAADLLSGKKEKENKKKYPILLEISEDSKQK